MRALDEYEMPAQVDTLAQASWQSANEVFTKLPTPGPERMQHSGMAVHVMSRIGGGEGGGKGGGGLGDGDGGSEGGTGRGGLTGGG